MMDVLVMINGVAVGIFGMLLAAAFCDIRWTRQNRLLMLGGMAGLLALQGIVYVLLESEMVRLLYPVITHIPLATVLCVINKKRIWPVIAVFTAYFCCHLRRWIALLLVALCSGDSNMQALTECIVTFPLLLLLLRFATPAVRTVSHESVSIQCQFGVIPVVAYMFDYLTQIYTDLFSRGAPVVAEFMTFVCCAAYLVFVIRTSEEKRIRSQLEQTQENLNLQVAQAVREIELLRNSQHQASAYRHDLRHHMQYLSVCIENNRLEEAQAYVQGICSEIEAHKVTVYCENEAANLIFSAFAGRARTQETPFDIRAEIPDIIPISDSDLCVLLSNALENALHACKKLRDKGMPAVIEASVYEKKGKLFVQIINSCEEDIIFDNGIPVTDTPGHGIGMCSICALVERYGGLYSFTVKDRNFVLRIAL